MNIADIVVIVILTAMIAAAIFGFHQRKKRGSCCGDCSRCMKCNNDQR